MRTRRGHNGAKEEPVVPSLTFLGAAGEVTGSHHLVQHGRSRVLVDCGLVQGGRDAPARNREPWGFGPHALDAVVLSHAHLDHSGLLPRLVACGYGGKVHATPATIELVATMLRDSAHLQLAEAARAARRGRRAVAPPLYGFEEVEALGRRMVPLPYGEVREIAPGVRLRLADAGHLLGSAIVELWLDDGAGCRRWRCSSTRRSRARSATSRRGTSNCSTMRPGASAPSAWPGTAAAGSTTPARLANHRR
jgi:metallo-beta-lactamase family protein